MSELYIYIYIYIYIYNVENRDRYIVAEIRITFCDKTCVKHTRVDNPLRITIFTNSDIINQVNCH